MQQNHITPKAAAAAPVAADALASVADKIAPMVPTLVLPTGTMVLDLDTSRTVKVDGRDVRVKGWAILHNTGSAALEVFDDDDTADPTDVGAVVDGTKIRHSVNVAVGADAVIPSSFPVAAFGTATAVSLRPFANKARVNKAGKIVGANPTYRGETTFVRPNGARYVLTVAVRANKAGTAWKIGAALTQ